MKKIHFLLLALGMLLLNHNAFSQNSGPVAPEAASFEPIDATDMVNLLTGDFTYVLPLLEVPGPGGGFPVSLHYHGGVAMDQEATWVGLGWNINPGAINRTPNFIPDDWKCIDDVENDKCQLTVIYEDGGYKVQESVSIGVGISEGPTIGVRYSWGEYKAVGGYVSLGIGGENSPYRVGANFMVGIDGSDYFRAGVSAGLDFGKDGNLSVTANVSGGTGGFAGGVSLGSEGGSIGVSLSSGGMDLNISPAMGVSASIPIFHKSIDIGDYYYSDIYMPLSIQVFWLNLGYSKREIRYALLNSDQYFSLGALGDNDDRGEAEGWWSSAWSTPDVMEINMGDDNNSYLLPAYDSYIVSGQGIGGSLTPYLSEKIVLSKEKHEISSASHYAEYLDSEVSGESNYIDIKRTDYQFLFENEHASYIKNKEGTINGTQTDPLQVTDNGGTLESTITASNQYSDVSNYQEGKGIWTGRKVDYYYNHELTNEASLVSKGFVGTRSLTCSRDNSEFLDPDGIGAFSVTMPDGKTYHYSLPVYQYEKISHKGFVDDPDDYIRSTTIAKYATSWLLTAITGPDYVDDNANARVDTGDKGYWVEFKYGKWTDGYLWLLPYGIDEKIINDKGEKYQIDDWGRKQVYYLDEIKTATHTAYFVKSYRDDGQSSMLHPNVTPPKISFSGNLMHYYDKCNPTKVVKSLKLDKIILVNNDSDDFTYQNSIDDEECSIEIYKMSRDASAATPVYSWVDWNKTFKYYDGTNVLLESNVTSDLTDRALKVVRFGYDLEKPLCKGTMNTKYYDVFNPPTTIDDKCGKLTLESVQFAGKKGNVNVPPYTFSYYRLNDNLYDYSRTDIWGFDAGFETGIYDGMRFPKYDNWIKTTTHNWSLKEITTPLGGSIKIDYEGDSYHNSVVNPEFTESGFHFNKLVCLGEGKFKCYFNETSGTDFEGELPDYFRINDEFYFDCEATLNSGGMCDYEFYVLVGTCNVLAAYDDHIEVQMDDSKYHELYRPYPTSSCSEGYGYFGSIPESSEFTEFDGGYNNEYTISRHTENELLQSPKYGGGVRVKKIALSENGSEISSINYNYNFPGSDITSGVTSIAPRLDLGRIPFGELLPGPGVMYEYVTVENKGVGDASSGIKTEFHFNLPKPVYEYSNKLKVGDFFDVAEVQKVDPTRPLTQLSDGRIHGSSAVIKDNLASMGRLIEKKTYGNDIDLLSKTSYKYKYHENITCGLRQETFKNIKHVYNSSEDDDSKNLWMLSLASHRRYPSILESTTNESSGYKSIQTNTLWDFNTGAVLGSEYETPMGDIYRTKVVPAYTKEIYSSMGSKAISESNVNMLSQEAARYNYLVENNVEKPLGVNIQTWKDYDDSDGHTIWRKHAKYSWKGELNDNGTLIGFSDNFNWGDLTQNGAEWVKGNEVLMYNDFSVPLESEDIMGRRSAMRTDAIYRTESAVVNSGYDEYTASGFENFSQEKSNIQLVNGTVVSSTAHTGESSVQLAASQGGIKFEEYLYDAGLNPVIKSGSTYVISFWVKGGTDIAVQCSHPQNGTSNAEVILQKQFGDWTLFNTKYEIISSTPVGNSKISFQLINNGSSTVYIDDFRIVPEHSSVKSYVYNNYDELVAILDNNNIATRYTYDMAGRLEYVLKETPSGFKQVMKHTINYRENQ